MGLFILNSRLFSLITGHDNSLNLLVLHIVGYGKNKKIVLQISKYPIVLHPQPLIRMCRFV